MAGRAGWWRGRFGRRSRGRRLLPMATTAEELTTTTPDRVADPRSAPRRPRGARPGARAGAAWPCGSRCAASRTGPSSTTSSSRPTSDAGEEDEVHADGDVQVVVPAGSVDRLRGARLEWSDGGRRRPGAGQPQHADPRGGARPVCLPKSWRPGITGPLALRVVSVLEQRSIPPSPVTAAGPTCSRSTPSEGIAYLRLSGRLPGLRHVADDAEAGDRDHPARRGDRADRGWSTSPTTAAGRTPSTELIGCRAASTVAGCRRCG